MVLRQERKVCQMRKLAIIDVGSNTTRMIVVNIYDNGNYRTVTEIKESVRLISDMTQDNIVRPRRIAQLAKTLQMFKRVCAANGITEIIPVLTAAVRRAANQRSLMDEVMDQTGIQLTLLTGEQESMYVYQGVINTMDIDAGVIMDIGGGTVELIHFEKRSMKNSVCLPFGTVTLTEQFGLHDRVAPEQFEALDEFIVSQLQELPWLSGISGLPIIGVGGSFRNVGKIIRKQRKYSLDLAHNFLMTGEEVNALYKGMHALDLDGRMKIKGLSNERADIFISSLSIITKLAEYINSQDIYTSCCGMREGIAFEHIEPNLAIKPVSNVLEFSLNNLSGQYNENTEHATRVAQLALSMFEQLRQLHKLPNTYMRLLKTAGIMHDVGQNINYYDHHRHSFYIILNVNLYGLTHREHLMAAFIAAGHRKDQMRKDYIKYTDILKSEDIDIINKLSVLLRIAESFDRCMSGVVSNVACDILGDSVIMKTVTTTDASLEIKDALTSGDLFKKAYGKNLVIL